MPRKKKTGDVRLKPGGPLVPWSEYCEVWGHYFRPDNTCVCGVKGKHVKSF